MDIYFWQNCLSPHQSSVIRSLSYIHNVTLITEENLPKWREEMGWELPSLGKAKVVINPTNSKLENIICTSGLQSIHIFSGIDSYKMVNSAFKICIKRKLVIGIMSEARDISGFKGYLKLLKGKVEFKKYERYIHFILAIGHLGIEYFKKVGYSDTKIFPYGYFIDEGLLENLSPRSHNSNSYRIYFVGRCIYIKGIDLLLRALANIKYNKWELNIIGDGNYLGELKKLSYDLGIENEVIFHGQLSNKQSVEMLSNADLLVLPSRKKDGWGAVVNEALMSGVPVVCSDKCGSSVMLKDELHGETFKHDSEEELSNILLKRMHRGFSFEDSTNIKNWAHRISGEKGAKYLTEIIGSVINKDTKPVPPWE